MEESRPGGTALLITVSPVPGKYTDYSICKTLILKWRAITAKYKMILKEKETKFLQAEIWSQQSLTK